MDNLYPKLLQRIKDSKTLLLLCKKKSTRDKKIKYISTHGIYLAVIMKILTYCLKPCKTRTLIKKAQLSKQTQNPYLLTHSPAPRQQQTSDAVFSKNSFYTRQTGRRGQKSVLRDFPFLLKKKILVLKPALPSKGGVSSVTAYKAGTPLLEQNHLLHAASNQQSSKQLTTRARFRPPAV